MQPPQPLQPLHPLHPLQPAQPLLPWHPETAGAEESSAYATETIGADDNAVNSAATAIVDFFMVLLP